MLIAGIDEAGRGPCFGPMTISVAIIQKEREKDLTKIGVRDSKLLLPKKREELFVTLKDYLVEQKTIVVESIELNDLMTRFSLNEIEAMKVAELLNQLENKIKVVFVDSPDRAEGSFEKRIRKYLNKKNSELKIVAEIKADLNYPIVGAASIFAKVTRDSLIKELAKEFGDFGSGYPSDPKTKEFLKEFVKKNNKLPPFSRIFWRTCSNALEEKSQKKLEEY